MNLNDELMSLDRKDFFLDERIGNIVEYTKMCMVYAIKIFFNPSAEDQKIGEKRYKVIKILDKISTVVFRSFIVYVVWKIAKIYFFKFVSSMYFNLFN